MQFVCLIYQNEKAPLAMSDEARMEVFKEYRAFISGLQAQGQLLAYYGLQPSEAALSVRMRDGALTRSPGPSAVAQEQLGGIYVIEAKDLDEAVSIAGRTPAARWGTIEVRLLKNYADASPAPTR